MGEDITVLEECEVLVSDSRHDTWRHVFSEHSLFLPLLEQLTQFTQTGASSYLTGGPTH